MKKIYLLSIISLFGFLGLTLYNICINKTTEYQNLYSSLNETYISSISTPRGRILDVNGKVLVDNQAVYTVVYRSLKGISKKQEIDIALELANILEINQDVAVSTLKEFYLLLHSDLNDSLITPEEIDLYNKRKITKEELDNLKIARITEENLNTMSNQEQKAALIYNLMNKGYYYSHKVIKKDISDEEYNLVVEKKLPGIQIELYWERTYPYHDTLRDVLGSVGSIPKEEISAYLEKGYSLDDVVGISYLEKQYEDYLKGEKAVYKVNNDNSLELVEEGKKGNDLYLSIDIDMQLQVEEILKEQIKKGKKLLNTEYYNGSYVVIGDPQNGAIKVLAGLKYINEDTFNWVEEDNINSSFTVGSVVKGASMAMAYQNNLVDIGKKINDSCVKLYLVPEKCSYKYLGYIDDITALKTSSNYYQFLLAIKLAGYKYSYDMKLPVSEREFNIYRDTFASFGLGALTGIDLPNEIKGIRGSKIAADLLLNLAIGQYDTYTPIQLLQYINTIASNGKRYALSLMDRIVDNAGNVIEKKEEVLLNQVELEPEYFERIKTGLWQVVNLGTGYGYTNPAFNPAGKTGTSEGIYDSNKDGIGDVSTVTNTYAMYAPADNPQYSMVVVSPNVSHYNGSTNYFAYINRYISKAVSDYLFSLS